MSYRSSILVVWRKLDKNVARFLRRVRDNHVRLLNRALLCRHQHGLALPLHGRDHLCRRPPRLPNPPLERPELDRRGLLAHPRLDRLPNRVARHRQKNLRRLDR